MAASRATSPTLTPSSAMSFSFSSYYGSVTLINRSSTGTVWFRTDGEDPAIGADDNYPVLPLNTITVPNGAQTQEPVQRTIAGTQLMVISDTACPITVYVS